MESRAGKTEANKDVKTVQKRAFLVFGAPCSGKTTFAEKFAKRFRAPYFDLNEIMLKHKVSRKTLMVIVEQLAKTDQMLVFEGGMDTERDRNEIRRVLRMYGYQPTMIWIQTDIGTIRMRLKFRTKSIEKAKEEYEAGISRMEAPSEIEAPIVLSGKHTFETQLRHVLTQVK